MPKMNKLSRLNEFPLKSFAVMLYRLRLESGLTQDELENRVKQTVGSESFPSKIISLWESGARQNPKVDYIPVVEALDQILSANGNLRNLYKLGGLNNVSVLSGSVIFDAESTRILVRLSKLIPDDLEESVMTSVLKGLVGFFAKTGFPVSDTEYCKGLIDNAIMIALSARE